MDEFEISSKDLDDSTSSTNVRTRVSTWLSGVIDEVRRKSPGNLQKWVDHSATSVNSVSQEQKSDLDETANELKTKSDNKFWNKFSLEQSDSLSTIENRKESKVYQLKSISKLKINELCEKVRQNKELISQIKLKKMDRNDKPETNIVLLENNENSNKKMNDIQKSMNEAPENDLIIREDEVPSLKNFKNNVKFKLSPNCTALDIYNENSIEQMSNISTDKKLIQISPSVSTQPIKHKNDNLCAMGRSVSEQHDDEMIDNYKNGNNFTFNKRSRSFTNVEGNKNNNYNNNSKNINNTDEHDKVSSSLPSFLDKSENRHSYTIKNNRDLANELDRRRNVLLRDNSYQSDSSHCSSVDSLLESRKPDPEAILINLGFGPSESGDVLTRIPKRFLQPSQVKGIDTEAFLRQQQMANHIHDHTVLGYRGLIGNPDMPPSTIVAKIIERFEINEFNGCCSELNLNRPHSVSSNSLEN